MALPNSFLDEIRARLTLSSVIGRRVKLVRKGREHSGLCPFHNEKTPSFTVNDEKGFFHCFGCGAHGDVIGFEMQAGNLPFREAVERLSAEAGLEMPRETPEDRDKAKAAAGHREVMEMATRFYEKALRLPQGKEGMAYLRRRGLDDTTIARFRLGYAPTGGALRAALSREGVNDQVMVDLGLIMRPDDGRAPFDYFRDRVLFPIADRAGRVVAFGARILGDGQPKYLNSPETPLFHKGRELYNLGPAREAARKSNTIIVAEGYMDVIALTRGGFANAVAPLGTALTESQLEALWRGVPEPILCFVGDAAGQRAAKRAMERALPLLGPARSLRFALLPPGQDPDDLLGSGGPAALGRVLGQPQPLAEMAWRSLLEGRDLSTPERQAGLEKDIDDLVNTITDRAVQSHYRRALRDRFWTLMRGDRSRGNQGSQGRGSDRKTNRLPGKGGGSVWSGKSGGPGFRSRGTPPPPLTVPLPRPTNPRILRERLLLATVLTHPEIFDHIEERLGSMDVADPTLDLVRQEIVIILASEKSLDIDGLRDQLSARGLAGAVTGLLRPDLLIHAKFARPGADPGLVKAGWDHTYDLHQRDALREDCVRANDRLGDHMTQEALEHFLAFKRHEAWADAAIPDGASFETTVEAASDAIDEGVPSHEGGSSRSKPRSIGRD
ncbi:MAG: DNA primase [Rhodospirillum sp.]|nr:DNA primase [Rhodospirillum sp.]